MSNVILTAGPIAVARNGVIGRDGTLPWRLKSDMALFKELTLGKPVIMGRKTWESLSLRPLPRRTNIVVSRDGSFSPKGAIACEDFAEAVQIGREQAAEDGAGEVCVIGGAAIFELALPRARRMYLTEVLADVPGDVTLAPIDRSGWTVVREERHEKDDGNDHPFVFQVLERS